MFASPGHPILQHHVQGAMAEVGYEVRPAIMRLYYGFRGGDRPRMLKRNSQKSASHPKALTNRGCCSVSRSAKRPWPRTCGSGRPGGLRRLSADKPLPEVVPSGRTPKREEAISDHPCLKPQHFMRILVRALLPLGEGEVLDPFMGSVQLSPLPRLSAAVSWYRD